MNTNAFFDRLVEDRKKREITARMKIDDEEWFKSKEGIVGQMPEITVTAPREQSFYDRLLKETRTVVEKIEKPISKAQKFVGEVAEKGAEITQPFVPYALPPKIGGKIAKAVTEFPFEIIKRPTRWVKSWIAGEERGKHWHRMITYPRGTPESKESARKFLETEKEMKKEGLSPETVPLEMALDLLYAANLMQGIYNVAWFKRNVLYPYYSKLKLSPTEVTEKILQFKQGFLDQGLNDTQATGAAWSKFKEAFKRFKIPFKRTYGGGIETWIKKKVTVPPVNETVIGVPEVPFKRAQWQVSPKKFVPEPVTPSTITPPAKPSIGRIEKTPEGMLEKPLIEKLYPEGINEHELKIEYDKIKKVSPNLTSETIQEKRDALVDEYRSRGFSIEESIEKAEIDPRGVNLLYKQHIIDKYEYHVEYKKIFNVINNITKDSKETEFLLDDIFALRKESKGIFDVYFAHEYVSKMLSDPKIKQRIMLHLMKTWAEKMGYDIEGVFGPTSGYTDIGKQNLLNKFITTTNKIYEGLVKAISEPVTTPTPPAKPSIGRIEKTPEGMLEEPLINKLYPSKETGIKLPPEKIEEALYVGYEKGKPMPKEIIEPENIPEIIKTTDGIAMSGETGAVSLEPVIKGLQNLHDWMLTFGEIRRVNPVLWDKMMRTYHEKNAAIEASVKAFQNVRNKVMTTDVEEKEIAFAVEDKTYKPPAHLKELYNKYIDIIEKLEDIKLKSGIIKEKFQDRMIIENNVAIENLKEFGEMTGAKTEKIVELEAENEILENMRYVRHNVAERVIESKLRSLQGEDKKVFLDKMKRISAKFKKRTGRMTLKQYVDTGIIEAKDVNAGKLVIENLIDTYQKLNIKDLYQFSKSQGLIKSYSKELIRKGWMSAKDAGVIAPELKGKLVHPLLGGGLQEMAQMGRGERGVMGRLRRYLGTVKIAQFHKPSIVWVYDFLQHYYGGMYSLNPMKELKTFVEASKIVMNKTEKYHELNSSGAYSVPYETPRAAIDEQINIVMRSYSKDVPQLIKALEKITKTSWDTADFNKLFMASFRTLANVTWDGDQIIRTASVLNLERMGYATEEACKIASRWHAAYAELSQKYKKAMSPLLFVHSFRVLMPMQMVKIVSDPIGDIIQAKAGKQKIPKHKLERSAKSIAAVVILPVLIDLYLRARRFEKDKFGWKWKREIIDPETGKKHDVVVGLNFILNMPLKYWHRLTAYNPIKPQSRVKQGINNFIQWEIHPAWRIFFWDILQNRRSFGSGETVYDPNASTATQVMQGLGYMFGESFKLYGKLMDAAEVGNITNKEKEKQQRLMKEAMNWVDKSLFTSNFFGIGYAYVRPAKDDLRSMALSSLIKEKRRRMWNATQKYEGKRYEKELKGINEWEKVCFKWIDDTYGKSEPIQQKRPVTSINFETFFDRLVKERK